MHFAGVDARRFVGGVALCRNYAEGHGPGELARFESAIQALPQVVEASHVSGPFDYLLKVVVADIAE